jgi:hypothetical protein
MYLNEYNEQRLINDFGKKLSAKYESEFHKSANVNDIVKQIASLDPTGNKKLTFWLVNNYAYGRIKRFEDIASRAIPELLKFKALLNKPNLNPPLQIRDINQIKGLQNLEKIISFYPDLETVSNKERDNQIENEFYELEEAELLLNNNELKVVIPWTTKASCFFGIGTKWCTAAKTNNTFMQYSKKDDPLFIFIVKGTNEKYQFSFESEQFMDENDEELNPLFLFKRFPILAKVMSPKSNENKINDRLAESPFISVSSWALRTLKISSNVLEKMIDSNITHLDAIAENSNTQLDLLEKIFKKLISFHQSDDQDFDISVALARNSNTSSDILEKLFYFASKYSEKSQQALLNAIGKNNNTSLYILKKLLANTDVYVRKGAVQNKNLPLNILEKLANNEEFNIKWLAQQLLQRRYFPK